VRRAFALIGDRYHEPGYIKEGLSPVFASGGVSVEFSTDVKALGAEQLSTVDLLMILRDGMVWPEGYDRPYVVWMTPGQEKAVADFVEAGGAFLPLHNATAIYPKEGLYRRVVGGRFITHPPVETFKVQVVNRTHPVTAGVNDYEVTDEQHFVEYDVDRVTLLLRSSSGHGEAPAGWAYEYGNGRVCFLANGHTLDALRVPDYQKLLGNAVRWCVKLT